MYSAFFVNRGGEQISGISEIRPGQTIPYGIFAISIDEESGNLQWRVARGDRIQFGPILINDNKEVADNFHLGFFEEWEDADDWIRKEMRRAKKGSKPAAPTTHPKNSIYATEVGNLRSTI